VFFYKESFINYLEDFDPEELASKMDQVVLNLGFAVEEARLVDIDAALKLTVEILVKQGGKIVLVVGNSMEYLPKAIDGDTSCRSHFYATDLSFSRIAAEMHKYLLATDLYVFGHKKNKNLGSLGELVRLSGGEISYYENADSNDRFLISCQIFQRSYVQCFQTSDMGNCVQNSLQSGLEKDLIRKLLWQLVQ